MESFHLNGCSLCECVMRQIFLVLLISKRWRWIKYFEPHQIRCHTKTTLFFARIHINFSSKILTLPIHAPAFSQFCCTLRDETTERQQLHEKMTKASITDLSYCIQNIYCIFELEWSNEFWIEGINTYNATLYRLARIRFGLCVYLYLYIETFDSWQCPCSNYLAISDGIVCYLTSLFFFCYLVCAVCECVYKRLIVVVVYHLSIEDKTKHESNSFDIACVRQGQRVYHIHTFWNYSFE